MRQPATLEGLFTSRKRPRGRMLSVCPVPGCTTLTMGGTCVAHDAPVTMTFVRGRPFVAGAPQNARSIAFRS
ncbi:MAG: hypothetical protein EHM24_32785 [Acidobacteria bacterium]|jgi:hypothetical protein|nr:MAG: hypothetical protein EHM24_32785 [Acidobacteriota bacterium]